MNNIESSKDQIIEGILSQIESLNVHSAYQLIASAYCEWVELCSSQDLIQFISGIPNYTEFLNWKSKPRGFMVSLYNRKLATIDRNYSAPRRVNRSQRNIDQSEISTLYREVANQMRLLPISEAFDIFVEVSIRWVASINIEDAREYGKLCGYQNVDTWENENINAHLLWYIHTYLELAKFEE